jgi:hypothetical protein
MVSLRLDELIGGQLLHLYIDMVYNIIKREKGKDIWYGLLYIYIYIYIYILPYIVIYSNIYGNIW